MTDYPEHEKLRAVADKSQACGEFIDWLAVEKGLQLWMDYEAGNSEAGTWGPAHLRVSSLLAEFFGIDEARLEREKRAMIDALREAQR